MVAAALRCLAHCNGAHLAYVGGLQPGGGAGAEGATLLIYLLAAEQTTGVQLSVTTGVCSQL